MHLFFLAKRCLVLLFTLAVVSSVSHKICQKLRDQQEKIRVLGEAFGGSLFIITTSGHLFKLKLSSTLRKDSTKGHYYLNIGSEPTSHVSERWPNVPLNLGENKNKLYALVFVQNSRKAFLSSVFKTKTGTWNRSNSGECRPSLEIGQSAMDWTVDEFERCNSKIVNGNEDAFMVSRECTEFSEENGPITFVRTGREYLISVDSSYRFTPNNNDTVLSASYLTAPYNILLFIYSSGQVEIRQIDTFPSDQDKAPEPDWTITISDFIQCEATSDPIRDISSMQQESPTATDVPGLWHTHTWRIVAVAVLLVLNGICLVLLYRKRYKKKKKEMCTNVKKRKSPTRSSIRRDSPVNNIRGSSPTAASIIMKHRKKVTKCQSSIAPKSSTAKGSPLSPGTSKCIIPSEASNLENPSTQGITLTGSTIKPVGSTLTIRRSSESTESGSPHTNESSSKGSSTQNSSKMESTPSSATVSNPSNVNSKASAKLSLAKKKQTSGKWIASLLWAKKPKDPKKDNKKK